jgi:peptidoglycan/xylan/chitin deacetylase (PgdA/CDA1 family)
MITFRRFSWLFLAWLMTLNILSLFFCRRFSDIPCDSLPGLYLGGTVIYLGVSVALAFLPATGFHHPVHCRARTSKKIVALTFDDGPDAKRTPQVLDILARHHVPAAFFLTGKKISGQVPLIHRMVSEGHLIGNHGWSHSPWFDFFLPARMIRELDQTNAAIRQVSGKSPKYFRPPYGVVNPMVSRSARSTRMEMILWSIRSLDTVRKNPARILHRILRQLKPGSIVLLHDHSTFSDQALEDLIVQIKAAQYEIVPLDQLLHLPAYE